MSDTRVQITRVRTGCLTCRTRKKKCDEKHPTCTGCKRNAFDCTWPAPGRGAPRRGRRKPSDAPCQPPRSLRSQSSASQRHYPIADAGSELERANDDDDLPSSRPGPSDKLDYVPPTEGAGQQQQPAPEQSSLSHLVITSAPAAIAQPVSADNAIASPLQSQITSSSGDLYFLRDPNAVSRPLSPSSVTAWLDRSLPGIAIQPAIPVPSTRRLWDYCGEDGFHLLGHYLSKTSLVISGGVRSDNPFLSQIMPIAMSSDVSSDLIMHLVLTMSAVHSAVASPTHLEATAITYYNRSLALFRRFITRYVGDDNATPMVLALGSLLLCFTETLRGDRDGAIFKHLKVADTLIVAVLSNTNQQMSSMEDFLVEFYIYVVTLSLVSLDPLHCHEYRIHDVIQSKAHFLSTQSFVGNLCGCWIDLLLLIPRINSFAAQHTPMDATVPSSITGDTLAHFATLHAEILAWAPPEHVSPLLQSSGLFYKHAIMLYLYTSAFEPGPSTNSLSADLITTSIAAALSHLDNIDPQAQINTLLCWPIGIVGSCLSDEAHRDTIRQRLTELRDSLNIANINDILDLLEALWENAPDGFASPWRLHHLMQSRNLNFSSA